MTRHHAPFTVSSSAGRLWIHPAGRTPRGPLLLKGVSWSGMQMLTGCVHELWRHSVDDYLDFLQAHSFNAIRIPLSAPLLLANRFVGRAGSGSGCGEYHGWLHLDLLDDLIRRCADAGLLVSLCMHALHVPPRNEPLWCDEAPCTSDSEATLFKAWALLARRYCGFPNVIMADLFNEPFGAAWGNGDPGRDWRLLASRLGNEVLGTCPRWLIAVQGVGSSWRCREACGSDCWWGENLLGQTEHPVELRVDERLVLSPHA